MNQMNQTPVSVKQLFEGSLNTLHRQTDRIFVIVLLVQWLLGILLSILFSPYTWSGTQSTIHLHVYAAIFFGGLLTSLPCCLAILQAGERSTRILIASAQMLYSGLLIHLMGGRIEAHFHIFGSLAILAFYRDFWVFVPAIAIVVSDHLVRSLFWPETVFGVLQAAPWRAVEHAAYVAFESYFLLWGVKQGRKQLWNLAVAKLETEIERNSLETRVADRTADIEASRQFLKSVLDSVDGNICILSENGTIIAQNFGWSEFNRTNNGSESKTGTGANYLSICDKATGDSSEGATAVAAGIREVLSGAGKQYLAEYACHSPTEKRWFQVRVSKVKNQLTTLAVVVHLNITQRVLAEQKVIQNALHLETLSLVAKYTDNSVIITNGKREIVWVNDGFTRLTGYESAEILGREPSSFLFGTQTDSATLHQMEDACRLKQPFNVEAISYKKNRDVFWLAIESRPIFGQAGVATHFVYIKKDITEAKLSRERLQKAKLEAEYIASELASSKQLLQSILQTIPDGISWMDRDLKYLGCNKTFASFAGLSSVTDVIGKSISDPSFPWTAEQASRAMDRTEQTLSTLLPVQNIEDSMRLADGTLIDVLINKIPLFSESGEVIGVLGVLCDTTHRKQLERELGQARKLESLGQLAAGIAHEINTPMQCITSNMEFLESSIEHLIGVVNSCKKHVTVPNGTAWEEQIRGLQSVFEDERLEHMVLETPQAVVETCSASAQVVEIVRAMKAMSHPGTKGKVLSDVNELIRNATVISRNRWKHVAELSLQLDPILPLAEILPAELSQVFLNLIVNAADAIQDRNGSTASVTGKIHISSSTENGQILIHVSDDGCGMSDVVMERIFDPFYTTKGVGRGTGQGLAISYDFIVKKLDGRISVRSQVGEGSRFEISLPCKSKPVSSHSEVKSSDQARTLK